MLTTANRAERDPAPSFSWRALARNPQALLMTGMVGTLIGMEGT